MADCTELRIGATEAGLLELQHRGIPAPDAFSFNPYSIVRIAGNGEPKGYGKPSCSWSWEQMDQFVLDKFFGFFSADTDAGVLVYISTYTDTGRSRDTTDYTAYMQRPVDGQGKAYYPNSGGNVSQNVTISFSHLETV